MKYVVKCPYCGHSYIIDAKEGEKSFQCDNCGGQNGIDDVVERIDDPVIVEKEVVKTVVVEKEVVRPVAAPKEKEADLQTIKNFDISRYPLEGTGTTTYSDLSEQNIITTIVVIVCVIIALVALNAPEQESEQDKREREVQELLQERKENARNSREARLAEEVIGQWMEAMNDENIFDLLGCYHIPEGSIFGVEDLREMIRSSGLEDFWGTDVQIDSMTFHSYSGLSTDHILNVGGRIDVVRYEVEFSNSYSKLFVVENNGRGEMKISLEDNAVSDAKIQTAMKWNSEEEEFEKENAILYIDNMCIESVYEEVEDEDGQRYGQYTIPLIAKGEHIFKVHTILGDISMPYEVTGEETVILMDKLQITEEQREEMAADLLDTWQQVQAAALNYAEPEEFRQFFHREVTDEEIEELAKQIRMEHDLRGDYEGAYITDIRIPDTYFCAVDYWTFIVPVVMDYRSLNEEHATGTCTSKIVVTATADGWKICENYDNCFFTLAKEEIKEE